MLSVRYGVFSIFAMGIVVLVSLGIEYLIDSIDTMLVPCQHGTKYINNKCDCLNTPFVGKYCETCLCENGFCMIGEGTTPSKTAYGCRCRLESKSWGYYCDQCNVELQVVTNANKNEDIGKIKCQLYAKQQNKQFLAIANLQKPSGCTIEDKVYYNKADSTIACKNCVQSKECKSTENCMQPYTGALCNQVCFSNFTKGSVEDMVCKDVESHGGTCNYCVNGLCTGETCDCYEGWVGKHCDKACNCNGHGSCVLYGDKAGCLCTDGYYGENCDFGCGECNGKCVVDYKEKSAFCECKTGFRGKHCELKCPGLTCSGHGVCKEDATCECVAGYNSPSCNCTDNLCKHGSCDGDFCKCSGNYDGRLCNQCKEGWFGPNCDKFCNESICKGYCVYTNGLQCKCKENSVSKYDGVLTVYSSTYSTTLINDCKTCAPGYYPSRALFENNKNYFEQKKIYVECQIPCTTDLCNGGKCVDTKNMCECPTNFDPTTQCKTCLPTFYPEGKCNVKCVDTDCLHGRCGPNGQCICEEEWSGSKCNVKCPNNCGNGKCTFTKTQMLMENFLENSSSCECNDGFYGDSCSFTCEKPPWNSFRCNAMGDCNVYTIYDQNKKEVSCTKDNDCNSVKPALSASVEYYPGSGPFCFKKMSDCLNIFQTYSPSAAKTKECTCAQNYNWDNYCPAPIQNCPLNTNFIHRNVSSCKKYLTDYKINAMHANRCYEQGRAQNSTLVQFLYRSDRKIALHNKIKDDFIANRPRTNLCPRVMQNRIRVGPFFGKYALNCGKRVEMSLLDAIRNRTTGCIVEDISNCPDKCVECENNLCKQCLTGYTWNGTHCDASKVCNQSKKGCLAQMDGEDCIYDDNCKNFCADKCCKFKNCKICGTSTTCQECKDDSYFNPVTSECELKDFSPLIEASCTGIDDFCQKHPILLFNTNTSTFNYTPTVIDFWVKFEKDFGLSSELTFFNNKSFAFRFIIKNGHVILMNTNKMPPVDQANRLSPGVWHNIILSVSGNLQYNNFNLTIPSFNKFVILQNDVTTDFKDIVLHDVNFKTKDCITLKQSFPLVDDMTKLCADQYINSTLDWKTYCLFAEKNESCSHDYEYYEDYRQCEDLYQGSFDCVNKSFSYDWSVYNITIPGCNSTCTDLIDPSFCKDRHGKLMSNTYNNCLNEIKNDHSGVCSALKCNCNSEFNVGVSGHSCQLTCPIGSNGLPCGGDKAGYCRYTTEQQKFIDQGNKYTPRSTLLGVCDCFDGQGSNCDMECRECQNKTNLTFVYNNKVYNVSNAICNKGRGLCECLPPYVAIKKEEIREWYTNESQVVYRRIYGTPTKNVLKVKMMQGKEAFMRYVSNYNDTDIFMDNFIQNPSQFNCSTKACSIHDVRLLEAYAQSSSTYTYNCNSTCPGTVDQIPCSGHGHCDSGQCICDVAMKLKTDSNKVASRFDTSGYRGFDCNLTCPGYDGDMNNVCNGHGECNTNAECECDEGWTGSTCQYECPGLVNSNPCNGHGTCTTTVIHLKQKRILGECKWSDCFDGIKTRHCPHFEYQSCVDNITRWSPCKTFQHRYVNNILETRSCGSTHCSPLCEYCDDKCFQCKKHAIDIGYGCTCMQGYKKINNECKKIRILRQTKCPEGCTCTNNTCTGCIGNRILISNKCYPLPCPEGQRWNGTTCSIPSKDNFFVPVIRKALNNALCSNYSKVISNANSNLVDDVECKLYAENQNKTFEHILNSTKPKGCFEDINIYYNDVGTNCSAKYPCIQRLDTFYRDAKNDKCMDLKDKPFVQFDMEFDSEMPNPIKQSYRCQIIDTYTVECPKCVCFDDDRHGRWDSFDCNHCQKGYGNSQCKQVCPGYDGINEQSMCNYPHGMCQFGTIFQGNQVEHPPVQCLCGENGIVGSGIENVEINNTLKERMVVKNMTYTSFGTISGDDSIVECDSSKKVDDCYHFDTQHPCTKCESGWSGENCRHQCEKCFVNGQCNENPSRTISTCSCTRPDLWELNCCPYGFVVEDIDNFDARDQGTLNQINIPTTYTASDTSDMSYWCKACPGVSLNSWLVSDLAKTTACGGPSRGMCGRKNGKAHCTCFNNTNGGYTGFNCRCKDSLNVAYTNEQTDYGCFGIGKCATMSDKFKYELTKVDTACFPSGLNTRTLTLTSLLLHEKIDECAKALQGSMYFAIDTNGTECQIYTKDCKDDMNSDYNMYSKNGYFLYKKDVDYSVFCSNDGGIYYERSQKIAEPGFYVPPGSQVQQYPCLKGYYQPKPGTDQCKKAPAGSYVDTYNSTTIKPCPFGTYSVKDGLSINDCKQCDTALKNSSNPNCVLKTEENTTTFCYDSTSHYENKQCNFTVSSIWAQAEYVRYEKRWDTTKTFTCSQNQKTYFGGLSKCLHDCYIDTIDQVYSSLTCTNIVNQNQKSCTNCKSVQYNETEMKNEPLYMCISSFRDCPDSPVREKVIWENKEYTKNKIRIVYDTFLKNLQVECIAKTRTHCVCKYGVQNGVCHHCNAGKYNSQRITIQNQSQCTGCEIGKYQDEVAMYSCKDCLQNTYQPNQNATSCIACETGKYTYWSGRSSCCLEGTQRDNPSSTCTPCDYGKYSGPFKESDSLSSRCTELRNLLSYAIEVSYLTQTVVKNANGWQNIYIGTQVYSSIAPQVRYNPFNCLQECVNKTSERVVFMIASIPNAPQDNNDPPFCVCFNNKNRRRVTSLDQKMQQSIKQNGNNLLGVPPNALYLVQWKGMNVIDFCSDSSNKNTPLCKNYEKTWNQARI